MVNFVDWYCCSGTPFILAVLMQLDSSSQLIAMMEAAIAIATRRIRVGVFIFNLRELSCPAMMVLSWMQLVLFDCE